MSLVLQDDRVAGCAPGSTDLVDRPLVPSWSTLGQNAGVAILYLIAAWLGGLAKVPGTNSSPFWPASGIALAAMMILGRQIWPGIMIGAVLANLPYLRPSFVGFMTAGVIGIGNTLEHVVGYRLLQKFIGGIGPINRPRHVIRFLAAIGPACTIAAVNGSCALLIAGKISASLWWSTCYTWWLGDVAGILVLTPAIWAWWLRPSWDLSPGRSIELALILAVTALIAEIVFGGWTTSPLASRPFVFILPMLIWTAFRFGSREISTLALIIALIAIANVCVRSNVPAQLAQINLAIYPPFLEPGIDPKDAMVLLQVFICVVTTSANLLTTAVDVQRSAARALTESEARWRLAAEDLQKAHAELENKVQERTVELTQLNARLQQSLDEKGTLLREIHHRVKNNLQVVSSLLQLQAEHTGDVGALEMFRESRNRVRSMALVHERLYQSPDLHDVDFTAYIRGLAGHLLRTYQVDTELIKLHFDVGEVRLGIDTAVPCGLIVNELMSNCLKHAFPHGRGEIRVGLQATSVRRVILSVSDNGVGLPSDISEADSFGLGLVSALVQQLRGFLEVERKGGTTFSISFPAEDGSP